MKDKWYKRFSIILVVMSICLFTITGCGGGGDSNAENTISATDSPSDSDIVGVYLRPGCYQAKESESWYGVADIQEDTFYRYESESDYLNAIEDGDDSWVSYALGYSIEEDAGRTIMVGYYEDGSSFPSSLTYFEDLKLLWVGGYESCLLFRKDDPEASESNTYLDYNKDFVNSMYEEDETFGEKVLAKTDESFKNGVNAYFVGKWVDQRDMNNSFTFNGYNADNGLIAECNFPTYYDEVFSVTTDDKQDSEPYWQIDESSVGIKISRITDPMEKEGVRQRVIFAPITDDLCVAYYADYMDEGYLDGNGSMTYGHGTVFKREK